MREAFEAHVSATRYVQHNPHMADGREAAIEALTPKFTVPGFEVELLRVLVDGPLACVHLRVKSPAVLHGAAVADLFRFEAGEIVEHWDVLQPAPEGAISAHPMF